MDTSENRQECVERLAEKWNDWFRERGIAAQRFPLYDSAVEIAARIERRQFEEFCEALGGVCVFQNAILENEYRMFRVDGQNVYAYYTAGDGRIRVICGKDMPYPLDAGREGGETPHSLDAGREGGKLHSLSAERESAGNIRMSVLNMSYAEQQGQDNGLCIVFTLNDGRFVIFDGGYKRSDGERLLRYLQEKNTRKEGITVAAWILTHGHEDHYGAFMHIMQGCGDNYGGRINVQYFIFNPILNCRERADELIRIAELVKEKYPASTLLIPHSGMKFQFGNLEMEVLFTHEDVLPQRVLTINDATVVTRLRAAGKTILMMGDCQWCVPLVQRSMGGYLKCDILQVPHHGDSGGTKEFYDLVDPETVIYTTSAGKFERENSTDWYLAPNYYLLNQLHVKNVIVADGKIHELTGEDFFSAEAEG